MCGCPRDRLCALCRAGLFDNLKGTAATRGEVWADDVARRQPRARGRSWPAFEGRAATIARRKVADLAIDPVLIEQLAAELAAWASRRWSAIARD